MPGAELGRISGQMLTSNLERFGVDLAFETSLLYLKVPPQTSEDPNLLSGLGKGIGIKTDSLRRDLQINGTTQTDYLIGLTGTLGNLTVNNNQIGSISGPIYVRAGNGTGTVLVSKTVTDDLQLNDNVISSRNSNTPIALDPNGTGTVDFRSNTRIFGNYSSTGNIVIDGNFSFGGNITVGDQTTDTLSLTPELTQTLQPGVDSTYDLGSTLKRWRTAYISDPLISNSVMINQNRISTSISNANLELSGNSSGGVLAEKIRIVNNTIENSWSGATNDLQRSIVFTPSGGQLIINSTTSLRFPAGTVAQYPNPVIGDLRYNTTFGTFSGLGGAFAGLYSTDLATRVTTPRDISSNIINFTAAGSQIASVDSVKLSAIRVDVDQVTIDNNSISSNSLNTNLEFYGNSSEVKLDNIGIQGSAFINPSSGAVEFKSTNQGYYRLTGTNAVVIPTGDTASRLIPAPEIGYLRFNTDVNQLEIWDGSIYNITTGAGSVVTQAEMEELSNFYTIVFG